LPKLRKGEKGPESVERGRRRGTKGVRVPRGSHVAISGAPGSVASSKNVGERRKTKKEAIREGRKDRVKPDHRKTPKSTQQEMHENP